MFKAIGQMDLQGRSDREVVGLFARSVAEALLDALDWRGYVFGEDACAILDNPIRRDGLHFGNPSAGAQDLEILPKSIYITFSVHHGHYVSSSSQTAL